MPNYTTETERFSRKWQDLAKQAKKGSLTLTQKERFIRLGEILDKSKLTKRILNQYKPPIVEKSVQTITPRDERCLGPLGFCIIKEDRAIWREEPRRVTVTGIPRGATVYVDAHQHERRILIGPWRVEHTTDGVVLQAPDNRNYVRGYPYEAIDAHSIIRDEDGPEGAREYLLNHPPSELTELIDLSSGQSLVAWALKKLDDSPVHKVIAHLNQAHPGWRQELCQAFERIQNSFEQKLEKAHWMRIEEIVQYLDFDYEQIQRLRTNPLLATKYEQALEKYKESIQQDAEQQLAHYKEQIEHKKRELTEIEKTFAELKQEIDRQGALPASPDLHRKPPADHPPCPQPQTFAVQHCRDFLEKRLLPALAAWLPDMTFSWAEMFHHAVRACKWILVPNPAWVLAYQEAMGSTATVKIVQIEPVWLSFTDAWQRDLASYWASASQDPTCLHLLLFEDVNRALPECWARPWLDVLAGFREALPVDGHPGWPENLRAFACLSGDQAALPLSKAVAQHWAAVSINRIVNPREDGSLLLPQDNEEGDYYQEFGPLARSLRRDLSCLRLSLQDMNPKRDVSKMARAIRIEWPQEYLQRPQP